MNDAQQQLQARRDQLRTLDLATLQTMFSDLTGKPCNDSILRRVANKVARAELLAGRIARSSQVPQEPAVDTDSATAYLAGAEGLDGQQEPQDAPSQEPAVDLSKLYEEARQGLLTGRKGISRTCVCGHNPVLEGPWHKCCPAENCTATANSEEEIGTVFGWRRMPTSEGGFVEVPQSRCAKHRGKQQ